MRLGPLMTLGLCLLAPTLGSALDEGQALRLAARQGDLEAVKRVVSAGTDVDDADRWGTTALLLAANSGHAEVVGWLLEQGADPNSRERFFGMTPMIAAISVGHRDIVSLLVQAGASERAQAFDLALKIEDAELARAVVSSGPVPASEKAALLEHHGRLEGAMTRLLEELRTVPDPQPPQYSAKDLDHFAGSYEGQPGDLQVTLERRDEGLWLLLSERQPQRLEAFGARLFRAPDGTQLSFYGRAETVEGFALRRPDAPPVSFRRSIADPDADAAESFHWQKDSPLRERTVHWTGFRGNNGSGIGDGDPVPTHWSLETEEGVRWIAELPGLANSSPIVWGNRIFVTTAVADGGSKPLETGPSGAGTEVEEAVEHRWLVLAFDKSTGRELWRTEIGRGIPKTKRHFKATQANSTPATDGRHVVVVFPTAGLACLDLDGKILWKHDLGGLNAGGFNDPGLEWGYASSPLIWEDRVILQVDIHEGPYLAAWELATGKPLWRAERPDVAPSWSTPALWETPSGPELVVNASVIRGYDPRNGNELWSLGPTSVQVVAMPVVGNEDVYVGAGYPPAKPIYAVRPGIRGDVEIVPGEAHPALRWGHDRGGAYMPTPLLYRGLLYIVHPNGRIVAYHAETGEALYKARFSRGGTFTNSPVAANGTIYTGTEEGLLYIFDAGAEYREIAVHDFDEPLMATPAISEGALIVRTPSRLIALARPRIAD